ncbi:MULTISPECIES: HEAT repeat domain-containing protein [unclassified Streptomyces]|uniref:HEAT repeat domain-containing protein n=1 Tax=unclassified Streptomyces TaxID=2593676 RepID=UPI0022B65F82|nr:MULTISPECIES: HEAT repeat domain-containing protein [unclassified Streptomyces]MCZ7415844.1 HEAT repeat domain-containing protein [Streptomyces sp. WMMC897]MCZ7434347.1 HEAT repeat domain-containing protein [Streptomyces sp. WMMC1477]
MEETLRAIAHRVTAEADRPERDRLLELAAAVSPADGRGEAEAGRRDVCARDALAAVLAETGRPLWQQEMAACALAGARDPRAFETLVFLLNHRDPQRCAAAAEGLFRLGDPRTARAAAALAGNELRTAYAVHPVRLLARLRAPESVPTLAAVLRRLLAGPERHWPVARACVEGLAALGDPVARPLLTAALDHPPLRPAAAEALRAL